MKTLVIILAMALLAVLILAWIAYDQEDGMP